MEPDQVTTPSSSLEGLPPELRGRIAEYLADVADSRSLASTSRTMRNSTDPYLFQQIFHPGLGEEMGRFKPIKLLRTLLEQPRLRKYVQVIESVYAEEHFECDINAISNEDRDVLQKARTVCSEEYKQAEDPEYKHHYFGAALALLFQLCPNIKEINLGMNQANCDCARSGMVPWLPTGQNDAITVPQDDLHRRKVNHTPLLSNINAPLDLFRRAPLMKPLADGSLPLSRLKCVSIGPYARPIHSYRWNIANASPLFRLPSLENLWIIGGTFQLGMDSELDIVWDCPENASNIKLLHLDTCELDTSTLCKILRSCKTLKTLEVLVTNGQPGVDQVSWQFGIDWVMVPMALQNSRNTLESLILKTGIWKDPNSPHAPNDGPIGSLKAFSKLDYLLLEDSVILGRENGIVDSDYVEGGQGDSNIMDILPSNLKTFTLQLSKSDNDIAPVLKQFARGLVARRGRLESAKLAIFKCTFASQEPLLRSLSVAFPSIEFKMFVAKSAKFEGGVLLSASYSPGRKPGKKEVLLIEDVKDQEAT